MTSVAAMLTAVSQAMPSAVGVNLSAVVDPWDLYEAYTFARVLVSARADGYAVSFVQLSQNSTVFVFRKGPGVIWSPVFSYARIVHRNQTRLQVHVGVRIEGQSGVAHEADVSVLKEEEAQSAIRERFHPRPRSCVMTMECKYYLSRLSLGILREYLGLTTDLRSTASHHWLVSNVSHPELPTLMKHHRRDWTDGVYPASQGERHFGQEVETALRKYRR